MSLKDQSLYDFSPIALNEWLCDQLYDLPMQSGESVDSYYGQFSDIVLRLLQNHTISQAKKLGTFITGLTPHRMRASIKEAQPNTLNEAYRKAKFLEETFMKIS